MVQDQERFYELDLFRFLAAGSVMLFHYTLGGYSADEYSILAFPAWAAFTKYGFLGVEFFFMISGFVILLTAQHKDFAGFVISRVARLYPAFWTAVTFTAVAIVLIGGDKSHIDLFRYLANLSMISGFFGVDPVDDVYWSLLVEIKFYFLIGIVVILRSIHNVKYYLFGWLLITLANLHIPLPGLLRSVLILEFAPYFIAGAVFYLIRTEGLSIPKLAAVVLAFYLAVCYSSWELNAMAMYYRTPYSQWVATGIIFTFFLAMFLVSVRKTRFINNRKMLALGALTYPLYLIHQQVGVMLFSYFADEINKYVLLFSVIGFMLALSWIINRTVERNLGKALRIGLFDLATRLRLSGA